MNTNADKTQENKNESITSDTSQKQGSDKATFQFVDNRPEVVAQRKLQEMANNSQQVSQLKVFQDMADGNSSPIQMTRSRSSSIRGGNVPGGDEGISSPKPGLAKASADPHAGKKAMATGMAEDIYENAALGAVGGGIAGGAAGTFAAPGIGTGIGAAGGMGIGAAAGGLLGAAKGAIMAPYRGVQAKMGAQGDADQANQAQDAQSAADTGTINTMNAIKGVIDDVGSVKTDVNTLKEDVRINKGMINMMDKGLI
jgi:gas vesicle protein